MTNYPYRYILEEGRERTVPMGGCVERLTNEYGAIVRDETDPDFGDVTVAYTQSPIGFHAQVDCGATEINRSPMRISPNVMHGFNREMRYNLSKYNDGVNDAK